MFSILPRLSLHTDGFPIAISEREVKWKVHGSARTTLTIQTPVPNHPLRLERATLLSHLLPHFAVKEIMSYHHEWCYNKVFLRLFHAGLMKQFPLPSGVITVEQFTDLMKLHSLCSFYLVNGNEVMLHRTGSAKSFGIWIREEDVQILDFTRGVNPFRAKSVVVHGRPEFLEVAEYLKVMQALIHHFGHSGKMKTPYIPARDNISRTSYEVMMICLKEYAFDLAGIKIFWKVDAKRNNRVDRLRKQVCEPALLIKPASGEKTFFFNKIVEVTKLVEHVDVIPDVDFQRRQAIIEENELFQMSLEDFPAGDERALEKLHCKVREKKYKKKLADHPIRGPTSTDRMLTAAERQKAQWNRRRKLNEASVVHRTVIPEPSYAEYLHPEVHGLNPFETPRFNRYYTEHVVKEIQTHNPDTQERWQVTANIEMEKVIKYGARVDYRQRVNVSLPGSKRVLLPSNRRDKDPIRKLEIIRGQLGPYHAMIAPNIRKLRQQREKERKERIAHVAEEYPDHVVPKELTESYNMKLLFYVMHVMGVGPGIACLTQEEMLKCIESVGRNHKIRGVKRDKKKYRLKKRDRKLVRMLLGELIA
jgi:hypothetical protein